MRARTQRQETILCWIEEQIAKGSSPTLREIGTHFEISSLNGVVAHLRTLRAQGLLDWSPGSKRTLRVPRGLRLAGCIMSGSGKVVWR